jgi:hypothetical protein
MYQKCHRSKVVDTFAVSFNYKEKCYQEQISKEKCPIKICSFWRLLLEFLLYCGIDYYYYYLCLVPTLLYA